MVVLTAFLLLLPFVICSVNAFLNRLPGTHPHETPFKAGLYVNLVAVPVYLFLHSKFFGAHWVGLSCGLVFLFIYLNCLVFLNWFIFTLTDVSMHIQLVMQIAGSGQISVDKLVARYNKDTILSNRIPRLLQLGQLRLEDGRLYLQGGSVLFGATVCLLLRKILGIPPRPEDADHSK